MIRKLRRLYNSGTLRLAIEGEFGRWLSYFGEKIDTERIIYNSWNYKGFHRSALENAPALAHGILTLFPDIKSVVDLGCGTGVYVSEFRRRGVHAEGYEHSETARNIAFKLLQLELKPFDLSTFTSIDRKFDLSISIEVAEHLTEHKGKRLVDLCIGHAPLVVFSAAHPGQPGQGHINLWPKSYWIKQFGLRGFRFDESKTRDLESYLRANLIRGFYLADNVGVYEEIH